MHRQWPWQRPLKNYVPVGPMDACTSGLSLSGLLDLKRQPTVLVDTDAFCSIETKFPASLLLSSSLPSIAVRIAYQTGTDMDHLTYRNASFATAAGLRDLFSSCAGL